ncbi:MAG: hydrolase 2, exosortase A system-associated [Rhodoglobus sp.]
MAPSVEALFVPAAAGGQRFVLHHRPDPRRVKGAVMYLHPFAEEMNKTRRMVAVQSRALAAAGFSVLQIDLLGCGDSSGDFAEATWSDWLADARLGIDWLSSRYPDASLWLWGARAGCLLAAEVAQHIDPAPNLLFWAPVVSGETHLAQFLRIRAAGEMLDGRGKSGTVALKRALESGESVDVAGYRLAAAVAKGLGRSRLQPPPRPVRIAWLDVASRPGATPAQPTQHLLGAWRAQGHHVHSALVPGPAFWQTSEIEEAPELVRATLVALHETTAT